MIDLRQDPELIKVAHFLVGSQIPSYIAEADLGRLGLDPNIPDSGFAIGGEIKKLPCHTKEACFLSRVYFELQRPELDSKSISRVDAKLAEFEKLHGIAESDLKPAVAAIRETQKAPITPEMQLRQVVAALDSRIEDVQPSEIVEAARELYLAGARGSFIDKWACWSPIKNLAHRLMVTAELEPSEKWESLIQKVAALSAREQIDQIGEILDEVRGVLQSTYKVGQKLAAWPRDIDYPVRLCGQDIEADRVRRCMSKIAALTELPVHEDHLTITRQNWREVLETAPVTTQRKILELL